MLWGERRGRATFGAVQRLPIELPMSHQDYHFDASRSLTSLEQDGTIIAVIEMSQSKWLVAALVPGVERHPLKKFEGYSSSCIVGAMKLARLAVRLSALSSLMRLAATDFGWRAGCGRAMSRLMSSIPRALRCRANTGVRRPIGSTPNS
jgi:hypothetical protein